MPVVLGNRLGFFGEENETDLDIEEERGLTFDDLWLLWIA